MQELVEMITKCGCTRVVVKKDYHKDTFRVPLDPPSPIDLDDSISLSARFYYHREFQFCYKVVDQEKETVTYTYKEV